MKKQLVLSFIALLVTVSAMSQTKYYVTAAGAGTKNGTSWTNASDSLQTIINAATANDTIMVAAGTYTGGFYMKEGIQVYGGFAGTEAYTTDNKPMDNPTILDGGNTQRVLTQAANFTTPTVWDGFTLQNGKAQAYVDAVVYNTEGTAPVGVLYRYNAVTGTGYMVGLSEVAMPWGSPGTDITGLPNIGSTATAENDFSGAGNTAIITKQLTAGSYAAYWCDTLTAGGFTSWYLPACGELVALQGQKGTINTALGKIGATQLSDNLYWSGSESDANYAWLVLLGTGNVGNVLKANFYSVRAVLAFNSFSNLNNLVFAGGGALLFNNGVLRNCVVTGNQAVGMGGGVYAGAGAQVQGCLVQGNQARSVPGVYLAGTGALLLGSTVANNTQTATPIPAVPTWKVGDTYPKTGTPQGVVFWIDATGEHGWIVALADANSGNTCQWSPDPYTGVPPTTTTNLNTAIADTAGYANTATIRTAYPIATVGNDAYAANKVDFANGWYLPAVGQLNILYAVLPEVNAALSNLSVPILTVDLYWSSTAYDTSNAWGVNFSNGDVFYANVLNYNIVRAVRAF